MCFQPCPELLMENLNYIYILRDSMRTREMRPVWRECESVLRVRKV